MSTVPQDLNWVEKREACLLGKVFEELVMGIENDVAIINQLRGLKDGNSFNASMLSTGTTLVVYGRRDPYGPSTRVKIGMAGNEILAEEEAMPEPKTISASVGLNNEGRCILRLKDGTELEQWQFRKIALERLFFGDRR